MHRKRIDRSTPVAAVIWCVAVVALAGCGDGRSAGIHDYYEWMNDPANGLVRESTVNGMRISMKYLSPAYLRYQRVAGQDTTAHVDTPANDSTVSFLMSIAPADSAAGDVMMQGISSEDEFTARAMNLNFEIKEMLAIRYGGTDHPVLLAALENVYGLSKKRDVMIVFPRIASAWKDDGDADIAFDDRIFGTGISHFIFHVRDLNRAPASIHS